MSASTEKKKSKTRKPARVRESPRAHPSARTRKRTSARARASTLKATHPSAPPLSDLADIAKPATTAQKRVFLESLFGGENISVALKKARVQWRQISWALANGRFHDAEFLEVYKEALRIQQEWRQIQREEKADSLALEGWKEPIFYKGAEISSVRRFSERMLELQLKRGAPHAYAERVEHSGAFNITSAIPDPLPKPKE